MTARQKKPGPPAAGPAAAAQAARLRQAQAALERIHQGLSPTPQELAAAPRLEHWAQAVDGPLPVLQGAVSGHPHLADGQWITTSPLLWLADDETAARTVSRYYRLGVSLFATPPGKA